jgi:hypothetical protein
MSMADMARLMPEDGLDLPGAHRRQQRIRQQNVPNGSEDAHDRGVDHDSIAVPDKDVATA